MSDNLITIRDLTVRMGGKPILAGVNADLARGKITALIGLNGAGKTTILRAILKEVPFQGEIQFHCGHDHSRPYPERIGYVPQRLNIDARLTLTVRDLLALALARRPLFFGIGRAMNRKLRELIEEVWMDESILDRFVDKISGGELQRVLLGLAMRPEPELLLLDEPAAGVDFKRQQDFYALISSLNKKTGVTVLLVSHELNVVSHHADHVLCLRDGRVECQGPPQEILTPEMLTQTFGSASYYAHSHQHEAK